MFIPQNRPLYVAVTTSATHRQMRQANRHRGTDFRSISAAFLVVCRVLQRRLRRRRDAHLWCSPSLQPSITVFPFLTANHPPARDRIHTHALRRPFDSLPLPRPRERDKKPNFKGPLEVAESLTVWSTWRGEWVMDGVFTIFLVLFEMMLVCFVVLCFKVFFCPAWC